ncbi:MAG: hypothetical protein ACK5JR_13885 [Tropicimonas sp.]|uniref:hypothetical protein n=1 Tax=Tropicimonas sp. TaxID=2067044 RepID=UPI003A8C2C70
MTTRRQQDLRRLKKVTEAGWLAASQTLRAKAGEERAAAARIAQLAQDRKTCMTQIATDQAGDIGRTLAATRWLRWSEAERAKLNVGLARLRAQLSREQDAARAAFARDQALARLLRRLEK